MTSLLPVLSTCVTLFRFILCCVETRISNRAAGPANHRAPRAQKQVLARVAHLPSLPSLAPQAVAIFIPGSCRTFIRPALWLFPSLLPGHTLLSRDSRCWTPPPALRLRRDYDEGLTALPWRRVLLSIRPSVSAGIHSTGPCAPCPGVVDSVILHFGYRAPLGHRRTIGELPRETNL